MMRAFWLFLAILIGGGLAAWLIGSTGSTPDVAEKQAAAPNPLPDPASPPPPAPSPTPAPTPKPSPPAPTDQSKAVRVLDARTIRLNDRFDVLGRGSVDDPFRVNWQLLSAAMESMDATVGDLAVPPWLEPLNGAWIEISGYFAPTMQSEETDELLFTMNRWDGCCIGLPPTVFDSLALRLDRRISLMGQHLIRFGTIRGELHIEPFAAGGMMLGLYRIEHGTITTQTGG
ncbi:MAG: hypothetical protein JNL80_18105 [Phycisphaerae bacterium]|jgi:hypothetical protein|nr:hypothetical protein [Phycisphaerae bacterium]